MWVVAWLCQGSTCHDTMGQVAGETMRRFTLQPKHDGQRKCVCFCLCLPTLPLEESSPVVTWKSCFFLITLTCLLWEVVLVSGSCLALWVGQSALMSFHDMFTIQCGWSPDSLVITLWLYFHCISFGLHTVSIPKLTPLQLLLSCHTNLLTLPTKTTSQRNQNMCPLRTLPCSPFTNRYTSSFPTPWGQGRWGHSYHKPSQCYYMGSPSVGSVSTFFPQLPLVSFFPVLSLRSFFIATLDCSTASDSL